MVNLSFKILKLANISLPITLVMLRLEMSLAFGRDLTKTAIALELLTKI